MKIYPFVFAVFLAFLNVGHAQTDYMLQMQVQQVQSNINSLRGENEALKLELDSLNKELKKKKTGANVAIGAAVLGTGFGAFGVYKGIDSHQKRKRSQTELEGMGGN